MIKELVFHIGDPKCGSSSIQQVLYDRAWTCDSVTLEAPAEINGAGLANALKQKDKPRRRKKEFAKKQAWICDTEADFGVLSSEFYANSNPQDLQQALHEFLPSHAATTRVIAYVRPHAGWVVSAYSTRVKTGRFTGTLSQFTKRICVRPFLYYQPRFDAWQKVFADRFTLRPFIGRALWRGDATADFFHQVLKGAEFSVEKLASHNKSLTLQELSAMRIVQAELIALQVPAFLRLSFGGAIGRKLAQLRRQTGPNLRLDRKNAERINATFRADAMALDAQFFDQPLMEIAMDEALEKASATLQSLEAQDHYRAVSIQEMRNIGAEVAKLILESPQAWRSDYQAHKRGVPVDQVLMMNKSDRANADAVWMLLHQLIQIMTKGGALKGVQNRG